MSLPEFGSPACPQKLQIDMEALCPASDRYRIFAQEIWPLLVRARAVLELKAYKNIGRDGVEPVWLLGVTVLQYWERVPDRQALELLRYHLGWNLALHRDMDAEIFHPTVLAYFRERLDKHKLAGLVFREVLEGLVQAGLVVRRGAQRLDSTQMWGLVSQMSRLECLRETLRLALQELAGYQAMGRPEFWTALWEEYVQGTLDYRASASTLQAKMNQAGAQSARLLRWLQEQEQPLFGQGPQVRLLRTVLEQQFEGTAPESLQQRPSPPA